MASRRNRARSSSSRPVRSTSLAPMRPVVGRSRPAMRPSKVDLPLPEGPAMAANWRAGISRLTSVRTSTGRPPLSRRMPRLRTLIITRSILHGGEGRRLARRLDRKRFVLEDCEPHAAAHHLAARRAVRRVHHLRSRCGNGLDLPRPGEHRSDQRDVAGRLRAQGRRAAHPRLSRSQPPHLDLLRAWLDGGALVGRGGGDPPARPRDRPSRLSPRGARGQVAPGGGSDPHGQLEDPRRHHGRAAARLSRAALRGHGGDGRSSRHARLPVREQPPGFAVAVSPCRHAVARRAARLVDPRRRPILRVRPAAESLSPDLPTIGGALRVARRVPGDPRRGRPDHAHPASAVHGAPLAPQHAATARGSDARCRRRVVRERPRARPLRPLRCRRHQLRRTTAPLTHSRSQEGEAGRGPSSGAGELSGCVTRSPDSPPCGRRTGGGGPTPPESSPAPAATRPGHTRGSSDWARRSRRCARGGPYYTACMQPLVAALVAALLVVSPATAADRVIVAFGDSLTAGLGVTPEESYPARLQAKLRAEGYAYRVINAGSSGDTTAGGLRRVDWALKNKPDIVIVALGANDALRAQNLASVRQNLDAIVARFQKAGARVLLAGMEVPPNYGAQYAADFRKVYAEVARKRGVAFMPFLLDGVAGKPSLNQADGIHPTAEGYGIVADHLWPYLQPLLTR